MCGFCGVAVQHFVGALAHQNMIQIVVGHSLPIPLRGADAQTFLNAVITQGRAAAAAAFLRA